jgi:hypothetical protein
MRKALAVALSICLVYAPVFGYAATPAPSGPAAALAQEQDQDQGGYQPYSPEQLDNLLAPIALYPDPLLAQVLPAATFPDQIQDAAQYVASNGQNGVDDAPWDVSVKAVAHYPSILNMMAQKIDWTTAVGQAFVNQSTDVTTAIQRLRHMAYAQQNLVNTPQQEVIEQGGYIEIVPAQPQYIYVPVYNPAVVYVRPAVAFGVAAIAFGAGFAIGAWLNRDWHWGGGGIYYTGWQGGGWIARSRGYVQINNRTYINNNYRNVTINRTVVNRTVNYNNVRTFNSVHNNVTYNNRVNNNTFNRNGNTYNRNTTNNTFNRNGNTYNRNTNNNTFNRNGNTYNRNANNNTFNRNGNTYNRNTNNNTFNRNGNTYNRNATNNTFNRNGNTYNRNTNNRGFQPQTQPRPQYQAQPRPQNRPQARPQYQPQARPQYQPQGRGQAPRPQMRQERPANKQGKGGNKGQKGGKNEGKGRHPGF